MRSSQQNPQTANSILRQFESRKTKMKLPGTIPEKFKVHRTSSYTFPTQVKT